MKDYKKRCHPNGIDGVIGKLMGLDQLRPQQPVRGTRRGLSDNYVRKAASIGLRPGSFVSIGRSSSTNNDNFLEKCVDSSSVKFKMDMGSPKPAGALITKSSPGSIYQDRRSLEKHFASGNVLASMQKLEDDSLRGHLGELSIDYMDNLLKPKSEKVTYDLKGEKSNLHFGLVYRGHRESLIPESGIHHSIVSPRHNCVACSQTLNRISGQERRRSKFEEVLRLHMGDNYRVNEVEKPVHSCPGVSDYTNNSHNQSLKGAEEAQGVGLSRKGQTLDVMLALADKKLMRRNFNTRLRGNRLCRASSLQSRGSDSSTPSLLSRTDVSEDNYLKGSSVSEFKETNETLSSGSNLNQDEATANSNKLKEQTVSEKDILEPKGGRGYDQVIQDEMDKGSENDSNCLAAQYAGMEAFDIEASLNELSEEESVASNPKNANQHSPASVLEPFDVQNSLNFESFDSIGLTLQLQALNFEAEETYSEGSVMLISGDEDIEEQFADLSHDSRKVKRWLGENESRNFSYMVDVLDEAGYCGTKSFMDFKKWNSLDCPISPLVFETLEKKYGKQTSWQKSERQLLFDRINSGLLDIFNPIIDFRTCEMSIQRWICDALRRDEIEDKLWTTLIRQENEKRKDLSEKAIGKWLEFEEGMDIICRDLETSLFDELVMEIASL